MSNTYLHARVAGRGCSLPEKRQSHHSSAAHRSSTPLPPSEVVPPAEKKDVPNHKTQAKSLQGLSKWSKPGKTRVAPASNLSKKGKAEKGAASSSKGPKLASKTPSYKPQKPESSKNKKLSYNKAGAENTIRRPSSTKAPKARKEKAAKAIK